MKKIITFKSCILIALLIINISANGQTKKERKAETISLETGMYNSSKSEAAMKYYRQAMDKSKEGDDKGAIKLYKKALKEDPNFVEAYDNMGVCYRHLGDFKNAIANYEKSIELYPKGAMAHMNLGVIYGIQKDYDKAIIEYEAVQEIDPEDPEGYYGLINIYMNQGKYKKAIENASKTLEIYEATNSPYLPEAQYLLGLSYYYDGDNAKAKVYMKQAKKSGMNIPQKLVDVLEL